MYFEDFLALKVVLGRDVMMAGYIWMVSYSGYTGAFDAAHLVMLRVLA